MAVPDRSPVHAPVTSTDAPSPALAGFEIHRVLVGLDGSEDSRRACAVAQAIAEKFSADLVGAHAVGLLDVWPEDLRPTDREHAHQRVREAMEGPWSEPLRRGGVAVELLLRDGPPAETLAALAAECHADLIIVGTRGIGNSPVGVLGSTSAKLVLDAHVPVLVVPPAA